MPETFGDVVSKLRLYLPSVPYLLVKDFVQEAYRQVCDERNWSFLRAEAEFRLNAVTQGNVTVTQGSPTVTSDGGAAGITFASTDVGRQLRIGSVGPPITILSVSTAGNTSCVLERNYEGVGTSGAAATVYDAYAVCPEDFGHFMCVLDVANQREVRIFTTENELNAADPGRSNTGQPWALVSYRLSSSTATLNRVMYEWWPYWYGTGTVRYPYYYIRRAPLLADSDYFEGPFRERPDIFALGARAQAALWPGTPEKPNPFFNLGLADRLERQFKEKVAIAEVKDEETYLTWWRVTKLGNYGMAPLAPMDARYQQEHDYGY